MHKEEAVRMKTRSIITLLIIILVVCVVVFFGMSGFWVDIYRVDPLPEQVNLGLDLTGGGYAVYEAEQGDFSADEFAAKFSTTLSVLRKRLDEKGFTEATIVAQGSDRIRVEVPSNSENQDANEIFAFIGQPAFLEFKDLEGNTVLTGGMVEQAAAQVTQTGQGVEEPVVSIKFNSEGAELFGQITKQAYDAYKSSEAKYTLDITLDGVVISSPQVTDGPIYGGSAIISGGATAMTMEDASDLAIKIESGALPLALNEIENRSINASLGEDALSKSLFGGLIGICLLFLFMLIYYRLPGFIACIALSIYMFIILLLLAAIPSIQLTLPGIAGIILGIGMAVDSNVIIFERFKEELASGKSLRASLNSGFSKALRTIIDSNITTVIAAIVISVYGVGAVKSFGYTLVISILVSLFTALVVTKSLLKIIMNMNIKNIKLYSTMKPKAIAKGGE